MKFGLSLTFVYVLVYEIPGKPLEEETPGIGELISK